MVGVDGDAGGPRAFFATTTKERLAAVGSTTRMHYMSPDLPPQVTDKSRKTKIFDYAIPISIDGRRGDVNGTLYWVGPANTSKLPFILIGVAIVLGGGLLVLFLRRRRRDEGDDAGADSGTGGTADDAPQPEAW